MNTGGNNSLLRALFFAKGFKDYFFFQRYLILLDTFLVSAGLCCREMRLLLFA